MEASIKYKVDLTTTKSERAKKYLPPPESKKIEA
jgi:hypothetical protein